MMIAGQSWSGLAIDTCNTIQTRDTTAERSEEKFRPMHKDSAVATWRDGLRPLLLLRLLLDLPSCCTSRLVSKSDACPVQAFEINNHLAHVIHPTVDEGALHVQPQLVE